MAIPEHFESKIDHRGPQSGRFHVGLNAGSHGHLYHEIMTGMGARSQHIPNPPVF